MNLTLDNDTKTIWISEIFGPTMQGEGCLKGKITVFVRTAGCGNECRWCDTLYAVLKKYSSLWSALTSEQIFAEILRLSGNEPLLVTLSGGDPAIQPLEPLIRLGNQHGYTFAIETQGDIAQPWFSLLDYVTLSPKPPSSGMVPAWEQLSRSIEYARKGINGHKPHVVLKTVVFDDKDFDFALRVNDLYHDIPMYLQVGNHTPHFSRKPDISRILERYRWLVERVIEAKRYDITVGMQDHILLWDNQRGK